MSKKPVSPLRQRLIDDITARRFSEDTKRDYVRNVRKFAAFLGRSPDTRRARIFVAINCIWRSSRPARNDQRRHRRTAVLFHRDARKARSRSSSEDRDQAAQGAGRPEPGGGGASPSGRAEPQVQGRAQRRLRRRPAGVRGREPKGVRHRQWAHDAQSRAGQGTAGSRRDAVAPTAPAPARMVEDGAAAGLAVSRPEPDQSCDRASAQPRRHRRQRPGWNPQALSPIRCATALRPTCSNRASTFA